MDAAWEAAVERGDASAVRRLLDAGSDVDARDGHGQTALMRAAHAGRLELVDMLVAGGADLDATAKYGLSAVMLAVVAGHDEVARRLAASGANLTLTGTGAPGFAGRTASDLARARGASALASELAPRAQVSERPRWAVAAAAFCAATVVFLMARDLFVPHVRDVEVWLGFEVSGALARWTAPIHWLVFAAGAWGFYAWRRWIWPWASVYAGYVAASHLIWNLTSPRGGGWLAGAWQLALLSVPAVWLWQVRPGRPDARRAASGSV